MQQLLANFPCRECGLVYPTETDLIKHIVASHEPGHSEAIARNRLVLQQQQMVGAGNYALGPSPWQQPMLARPNFFNQLYNILLSPINQQSEMKAVPPPSSFNLLENVFQTPKQMPMIPAQINQQNPCDFMVSAFLVQRLNEVAQFQNILQALHSNNASSGNFLPNQAEPVQNSPVPISPPPPAPAPPQTSETNQASGDGSNSVPLNCKMVLVKNSDDIKAELSCGLQPRQRRFVCDFCDKSFYQNRALLCHVRIHATEKSYQCSKCPAIFKHANHRDDHERTHMPDYRPFVCDKCGRGFARKYSLLIHSYIHAGIYRFSCSFCGKLFRQAADMRKHEVRHSQNRIRSLDKKTIQKTVF